MYRKNDSHQQLPLISTLNELPEKQRRRLEESWAGTFYREFFCRLDENPFAVLYSGAASRPNIPINVLVGLEVMKAGFGWSDEEMYDEFCYNLQVRYALGYRNLDEGQFELRTVYNFRRRLTSHMQATGENLLEKVFKQVTDEQLEKLEVKTGKLRMDSTQIASNIREMSRLQLLVEVVQRTARVLSEVDKARYKSELEPYLKGSSGQYMYRLKPGEYAEHLLRVGQVMLRLVTELEMVYAETESYRLLARVFNEHFVEEEDTLRPRRGSELKSGMVQSPDDLEATYRNMGGKVHVGYVANIAETCDPENKVQLIVSVQTEPNKIDDAALLAEEFPDLKARTNVQELHTDGNYNSPDVDELMRQHKTSLIQTAIRGGHPDPDRLGLEQFDWETNDEGWPTAITCPHGQRVAVKRNTPDHFVSYFDTEGCDACPLLDSCPSKPLKRTPRRVLHIKKRAFFAALRKQASLKQLTTGRNLRAAAEATVRSVKHPFRQGKLPVRGKQRMSMMVISSAAMTNIKRIWRYEFDQANQNKSQATVLPALENALFLFWLSLSSLFSRLWGSFRSPALVYT